MNRQGWGQLWTPITPQQGSKLYAGSQWCWTLNGATAGSLHFASGWGRTFNADIKSALLAAVRRAK